jgi:hypothetical protein
MFEEGDIVECVENDYVEDYIDVGSLYVVDTVDHDSITLKEHKLKHGPDYLFVSTRFILRLRNKPMNLPDNNPKTAVAASKARLSDVPPVALFALGAAMSDGAAKYGRFNYRDTNVTASVFYDAMMRHLADWYNGEDCASDSKLSHLGHLMASCAIILDAQVHSKFNDDRDKRLPEAISRNTSYKAS